MPRPRIVLGFFCIAVRVGFAHILLIKFYFVFYIPCNIMKKYREGKAMKDKLAQMPTISEIRAAVVPLAGKYGLDKVFLFGSYARGEATAQSDIDIRINRGALDRKSVV